MKARMMDILMLSVMLLFLIKLAFAEPYGPTLITVDQSSRANFSASAKQIGAQAGNVTQLTISTQVATRRWQGYYGNITGGIALDDAQSNTMGPKRKRKN